MASTHVEIEHLDEWIHRAKRPLLIEWLALVGSALLVGLAMLAMATRASTVVHSSS